MLSDRDYELLDRVLVKLRQADNTCSDEYWIRKK